MFPQRLIGRLSEDAQQLALRSLDAVLASRLARTAADHVLASPLAEHVLDAALRGPLIDELASDVARHRVVQRIVDPLVIESDVVDETVARLLESEELWFMVDEIARSPAVTEAISHQGAGLADQVAGVFRDRSRHADARLERFARRALRRGPRVPENGEVRPGGG